jgi:murein DD-endopeptidase MepM/ murein hydrolase activator NlpD
MRSFIRLGLGFVAAAALAACETQAPAPLEYGVSAPRPMADAQSTVPTPLPRPAVRPSPTTSRATDSGRATRPAPGAMPPINAAPPPPAVTTAPLSGSAAPAAEREPLQLARATPAEATSTAPVFQGAAEDAAKVPPGGTVIVRQGDTVFALARRHNVTVRSLIDGNQIAPPFVLRPGEPIILPRAIFHTVDRGETLYGISRQYDVDTFVLARANDLSAPYHLMHGQKLRIPTDKGRRAGTAVAMADPKKIAPDNRPASTDSGASVDTVTWGSNEDIKARNNPIPTSPPRSAQSFAWPLSGRVISSFGPKEGGRHNDGINIAARRGEMVRAAENGIVIYAGNELKGFGNLLLIRHADRWITAYAHNDKLLVRRGDWVRRGQSVARAGSTGGIDSPQLHFEIRRGTQAVDPMPLLASMGAPTRFARLPTD